MMMLNVGKWSVLELGGVCVIEYKIVYDLIWIWDFEVDMYLIWIKDGGEG